MGGAVTSLITGNLLRDASCLCCCLIGLLDHTKLISISHLLRSHSAGPKKLVSGAVFFGGIGLIAESICTLIGDSVEEYKDKRTIQKLGGNDNNRN